MVTAIVLVEARRDAVSETAQALTDLAPISEVYSVAGDWDLVAMVRAKDDKQMAQLVTGHMLKLDGIEKTTTLVAFQVHCGRDLESMPTPGFEEK